MTKRTAVDTDTAGLLLAHASKDGGGVEAGSAAAVHVYETLARRLTPLIGAAGHAALVARSARLVAPEYPCLEGLTATGGPSAERLAACLSDLEEPAITAAATALYGTLLALLTTLIGERLVARVLSTEFPAMNERVSKESKP